MYRDELGDEQSTHSQSAIIITTLRGTATPVMMEEPMVGCWKLHSAGAAKWINKGGGVVILVICERNIMYMLI